MQENKHAASLRDRAGTADYDVIVYKPADLWFEFDLVLKRNSRDYCINLQFLVVGLRVIAINT
jgi:hypothetical protein